MTQGSQNERRSSNINKAITEPEYTVSFTAINWYNTPSRVMVAYLDESNYYSFSPTTGHVYRRMDGALNWDRQRESLIGSPKIPR